MSFDYDASSLYSVIADRQFRPTNAGKPVWQSLIAGSYLQSNCGLEGFNLKFNTGSHMRIGILGNNEHDCKTCDSSLGFSFSAFHGNTWTSRTVCGNLATCCRGYTTYIKTFGYILVR